LQESAVAERGQTIGKPSDSFNSRLRQTEKDPTGWMVVQEVDLNEGPANEAGATTDSLDSIRAGPLMGAEGGEVANDARCKEASLTRDARQRVNCNKLASGSQNAASGRASWSHELTTRSLHGQRGKQRQRSPYNRLTAEEATRILEAQQGALSQSELVPLLASKVPIILVKLSEARNHRGPNSRAEGDQAGDYLRQYTIRLNRSKPVSEVGETGVSGPESQLQAHQKQSETGNERDTSGSPNELGQAERRLNGSPADKGGQLEGGDDSPLECNMRRYTFKASKSDGAGNRCSGLVSAAICYGGCETGEIADWLFPHKKSIHKVCTHGERVKRRVSLTDCTSELVEPSLRHYHFVEATSCVCKKCTSVDTTCLGSLTRPYLPSLSESGPTGSGEQAPVR